MTSLSINRALPTIDGMLIKHIEVILRHGSWLKNPVLSTDVEQC